MTIAAGFGFWPYVLGGLLVLWIAWTWNAFVRHGNRVREAHSGIDVQLKRRHDLVPNLVRVVKAYATHEQETLEGVVQARNAAAEADALPDREASERGLQASLGKLFALVEAYPQLKADKNFRALHGDLVEIEDALQYARRYYNGTVRDWNNLVERVPSNIIASFAGKRVQPYFQVEDAAETAVPRIDFTDSEA
ncbi:MAG: LemA family protein [Planctomycetota bacterium]|nr:LemA family protein [Planctomycetota bacterium]